MQRPSTSLFNIISEEDATTNVQSGLVLSGHYSRDWSEYVNVIGVISEPFDRELR